MKKCGCNHNVQVNSCDPCTPPFASGCTGSSFNPCNSELIEYQAGMIDRCYEYAAQAKKSGRPIIGIMCEYTPREIIMAAGAVPVCLCGGSAATIPAAEEFLPANLCPLIKSTFGYHVQKSNPFLEMADMIVAETTCDGKKKMYELLAEERNMYVLELTQKSLDPDAFDHWVKELHKLKAELERQFGCQVTDDKIRQAVRLMNRERQLRRAIARFMQEDNPCLTGRELLEFKSIISGIDSDLDQYQNAIDTLSQQPKPARPDTVRAMITGVPMAHGAERVIELVEKHGGLVVCQENCTGLKPILDDVDEDADDILYAIADNYFRLPCSVMTGNQRRLDTIKSLVEQYRPQCVIDVIWQACLTYDVESQLVKKYVEQQLGLPYLRIETDYNTSDSARIALRVEALFETIVNK